MSTYPSNSSLIEELVTDAKTLSLGCQIRLLEIAKEMMVSENRPNTQGFIEPDEQILPK